MPTLVAALLAAAMPGLAPCDADVVEETANVISDGSFWVVRALPPAMALFGGEKEERIGRRMLDAGIASGLAAEGLKRLTKQSRPDDPNAKDGFPSGHATAAWALADAAGTEDPDLRPYTYAFAAAVTWSRVELNRHTVWQALAGSALGYGVARASASSRKGVFGGLFVKEGGPPASAAFSPGWTEAPSVYQRPMVTLWEVDW
ncbi:MAG: phosphatase PAP2 family protein [Armatimonadetes bacterium]|nr:phosphatase PAP2 family protein [Armatimonadota bacterium]